MTESHDEPLKENFQLEFMGFYFWKMLQNIKIPDTWNGRLKKP